MPLTTPLKLERKKLGLTTEEVAIKVGVKQPTICRIENGTKGASLKLASRIAKLFPALTRDQILFPLDYVEGKKPARGRRAEKASA